MRGNQSLQGRDHLTHDQFFCYVNELEATPQDVGEVLGQADELIGSEGSLRHGPPAKGRHADRGRTQHD